VVNKNSAMNEIYLIAGQPRTSSQTNVSLAPTILNGTTIFDIFLLNPIDSGDGVSVQVKSADGNNVGSAFTYIKP